MKNIKQRIEELQAKGEETFTGFGLPWFMKPKKKKNVSVLKALISNPDEFVFTMKVVDGEIKINISKEEEEDEVK